MSSRMSGVHLRREGPERRDNLAYKHYAPRKRRALSVVVKQGTSQHLHDGTIEKV